MLHWKRDIFLYSYIYFFYPKINPLTILLQFNNWPEIPGVIYLLHGLMITKDIRNVWWPSYTYINITYIDYTQNVHIRICIHIMAVFDLYISFIMVYLYVGTWFMVNKYTVKSIEVMSIMLSIILINSLTNLFQCRTREVENPV